MKKQTTKRLVLHKETVRTLTANQLDKIAGGIPPSWDPEDSCYKTCWCETAGYSC